MARKKQKNITIKDPESQVFFGVICLIISGILFVGIFTNSTIMEFLSKYFGLGIVVLAAFFLVLALRLLGTKTKFSSFGVAGYLFLFLISFLGWVHLFAYSGDAENLAQDGKYGGIIGYNISSYLVDYLLIEGAFVVLGILTLTFLLATLKITPNQVSEFILDTFTYIKKIGDYMVLFMQKIYLFLTDIKTSNKTNISIQDQSEDNKKPKTQVAKSDEKNTEQSNILQDIKTKMVSDISGIARAALGNTENKEEKKDKEKKDISDVTINMSSNTPKAPAPEVLMANQQIANNSLSKNLQSSSSSSNNVNKNDDEHTRLSESNETNEDLQNTLYQINYPEWNIPPENLLDPIKPSQKDSKELIQKNAEAIIETLESFNIKARVEGYVQGPSVTQYFIDPAAGVKFQKIANLSQDLSLTLATKSPLRIEQVPGTSFIGIDVPNAKQEITQLKRTMKPIYKGEDKQNLGIAIGIDISGKSITVDLQKMPHLLIAGATGQGKSVLVNAIIISLLLQKTPDELKIVMIDPKMVEFVHYDGIPHLITSPITDVTKAATALKWAVNEMEERYTMLKEAKARNIEQYREETGKHMPYIAIIVDEYADLMMTQRAEVEASIIRIAQKARAVGIHLVIATQRPTADIITGTIKGNIPSRIALKVASQLDSRLILDVGGAETLIGRGDLLYKGQNELRPIRIQGLFTPDSEQGRILQYIKDQTPDLYYDDSILISAPAEGESVDGGNSISDDPLFKQAAELVINSKKGSASYLQTKMKIGFARASRLIDELEGAGIVGPADGPKQREVLASSMEAVFGNSGDDA